MNRKLRLICIFFCIVCSLAHAVDWMPDAHLEQAVREKLEIPDTIPIHPGDIAGLHDLFLIEHDIRSLRGLEYAVNLKVLAIGRSEVSDLTPLAGLENLEFLAIARSEVSDLTPLAGLKNLRTLKLYSNRITDITPLTGLVNLELLQLQANQIADISPLAGLLKLQVLQLNDNLLTDISPLQGLVNLKELQLEANQITDISPLAGLVNLKGLALENNPIVDISPLQRLVNLKKLHLGRNKIIDFTPIYGLAGIEFLTLGDPPLDSEVLQILKTADRIVSCDIERAPILPRIENREHPSVFQAQGEIMNLPKLSREERLVYHDLFFGNIGFGWVWTPTPAGFRLTGDLEEATIGTDRRRGQNPNLLLLANIDYYAADSPKYPEDWPYWLRDESGNILEIPTWDQYKMDFTHPAVQEMVIQQAIEVAKCGLYDGIHMDHWGKGQNEKEHAAKDRIMQGIRDAVGDDFLILVTTTANTIPRHAEYINGLFMETIEGSEGGYTYAGLTHIENTLLWAEQNLREPQVNCLAGRGFRNELLDSPRNLQWMRLFTTMGLTHADGYVMFTMGGSLDHPSHPFEFWPGHADDHAQGKRHSHQNTKYWYDFYDAPLGRPIGSDETKGVLYETPKGATIEGLFIREYTNGWAVYNRSGKARMIQLPEKVSGVASGVENKRWHTLPDLDGEIFLKQTTSTVEPSIRTKRRYDVNDDGDVDVSDVRLVVIALGQKGKNIKNLRTDVNKNKKVDKNDVLLVIDNLDDTNGAPLNTDLFSPVPENTMQLLNPMILRSTLEALYLENDGTLKYQQAIAYLQYLLAAIRPDETQLFANYPNPFNPETWIPYQLANSSEVVITIYDAQGSVVRRLDLGHQHEGYYTTRSRAAYWDGRNAIGERVASGIYFYQLQADGLSYLRKMVIVK